MTPKAPAEAGPDDSADDAGVRGLLSALEQIATLDECDLGAGVFLRSLLELFCREARVERALVLVREPGASWAIRVAIGVGGASVEQRHAVPEEFESFLPGGSEPVALSDSPFQQSVLEFWPASVSAQASYCAALRCDEKSLGLFFVDFGAIPPAPEALRLLRVVAKRARGAVVLHQTLLAMEAAIAARDDVISVVAHDLRNPINVISLAAHSLHQRMSDASSRRTLERIVRAVQRGDRLIRDLLEVSAIQAGHFTIEKRRLETASTILTAIESQQGLAASASIILGADVAPELPSIEGDEERLLEVLENLIGNAVKFTNTGGAVIVGASCREEEVLVWVKDTGQGIAPEHLPHLFDRFWQARKQDRRGAGLGLTICKGIVEAHRGSIWAESTVGKGTTVFFTIPTDTAQPREIKPIVSNLLIVDDRPENLLSLKAILERPDYRLFTARSGEEALSLALREQFSVALIDIAMPGMDGLEVAVLMKELERSRDIPIIFITAFGDDPEEVHRAYAAGGADYLVKPLNAEIVRKKVAVFVDLNRRRQQGQ